MVVHHDRPRMSTQPVDALANDFIGLAHLLDTHQVTIVTIPIDAHRNLEIQVFVHFIGLLAPQIPLDSGAAQHGAGKAQLKSALRADNADIDRALFPDPVLGQQGFIFIHTRGKTLREVLDEVQQ